MAPPIRFANRDVPALDDVALVHKAQGAWVYRRWQDVQAEIAHYAAGLAAIGLRPDGVVAFQGEISPRMLLVAAAVRASRAMSLCLPLSALPAHSTSLSGGRGLTAVVVQKRDAMATWSGLHAQGHRFQILLDHAMPDGRTPLPSTMTLDQLRLLEAPAESVHTLPEIRPSRTTSPAWVEESTDWPSGLDALLERWFADGRPLALPEQLNSAAYDRRTVSPGAWLASADALERAARAIRERLPAPRTPTGRLVEHALAGGRSPLDHVVVHRIRRQFGLAGMAGIELANPEGTRPSLVTRQLFQNLRVPIGQVHRIRPTPILAIEAAA